MKRYETRLWFGVALCAIAVLAVAMMAGRTGLAAAPELDDQRTEIPELPAIPFNYSNIQLPPYFNNPQIANANNTPGGNPITDHGATLGRVLFYDVRLSANDTVACASCHLQANGFSDPNRFSVGFAGGVTGRNSMGFINGRYYENGHFFWDERADTLEDQVLMPIQDPVEMGMDLAELEVKLAATSFYPELFENAFGDDEVTSERMSLALAQFIRSVVSYQSRFDQGIPQNFANFTAQENLGRQIFTSGQGRCSVCHRTEIQITNEAINNGLDATTTDLGLAGVTGFSEDEGKFKVPSLRNIGLTGPYMHDGRFATLQAVVTFYNEEVQAHPNLDPRLQVQNGQPRRLNLSEQEQAALVAFLLTLTDPTIANEEKWSDPFVPLIEPIMRLFLPLVNQP